MDLKQIEALLRLCRKHGLQSLKLPDIELSFGSAAPPLPGRKGATTEQPDVKSEFSEEDALFWSASS